MLSLKKGFDMTQATKVERVRDPPVTPDKRRRPASRAAVDHRPAT
jgi:hypothetical protein